MRRDVQARRRPRMRIGWDRAEVLLDQFLHLRGVHVTDRDHRHAVRRVPIVIEVAQARRRPVLDDLGLADRQPVGVMRAVIEHRHLLAEDAVLGALPEPPFLEHDTALLLDLAIAERRPAREVRQRIEPACQHRGAVGRDLEHVHRFVEAGVRVGVRTEAHADRSQGA